MGFESVFSEFLYSVFSIIRLKFESHSFTTPARIHSSDLVPSPENVITRSPVLTSCTDFFQESQFQNYID